MIRMLTLNAEEKEFARLVHGTVFSNPFSDEHEELVRQFSGVSDKVLTREIMAQVFARATEWVERFAAKGKADIRRYAKEDERLVKSLLLYETYGRFIKDLDQLIDEQIRAGDQPCPVPFAGDALSLLVRRGFSAADAERFLAFFYQIRRAFHFIRESIPGQAPSARELRCHLWNNVFTFSRRWYEDFLWDRMEDFSTLLLGETGSGKGAAAAAIGRSGFIPYDGGRGCFEESFNRNFIELNLSQYPETLIESALFGHQKGAFTGAIADFQGGFARCTPHGAILLDEIGDVSTVVQVKLLKVLQERTFTPVGGSRTIRFRGRVIAATNQDLDELRRKKAFRDDFFYRLCSDIIAVPPLRQRLRENPLEMEILLEQVIGRILGAPSPALVETIRETLEREVGPDYPWPGNIRELEQAARRILLTGRYLGDTHFRAADLRRRIHQQLDYGTIDAQGLVTGYCALLHERCGSYEEVARRTRLDRRTVKKYIQIHSDGEQGA